MTEQITDPVARATGGDLDASAEEPQTVRPALRTLLYDQAALFDADAVDRGLEHGLRGGFPGRKGLIEWYQRAIVRTLGYLADRWRPQDMLSDETLLAGVIEGGTASTPPMPSDKARQYRAMLEAVVVHPACVRAYSDLRGSAGEYVGTDGENLSPYDINPAKQANVAMRPGYQVLDRQQRRTLSVLWGGFDNRGELLDWLHSLNAPTAGELRDEFAQDVLCDSTALHHLLHAPDTPTAQLYRQGLAVAELLPAFVDGVRRLSAGEAIELKRTEDREVPPG